MRAKIFSFVKVSDSSVVASVRIARWVSEQLDIGVIDDEEIGNHDKLDVLIIVNGAFAFCKHLEKLAKAIEGADRVIWIRNDYTIIPPTPVSGAESPFRKAFRNRHDRGQHKLIMWSTCIDDVSYAPLSVYLNWNCLTFDDSHRWPASRSDELIYYGSFRANRRAYFDRYFMMPRVKTVISSPSKKFRENYEHENLEHHDKIEGSIYEELSGYGLGLYIEDRYSHNKFCSPANRFYEMLSAGLPMIFQPECGSMMRKAGYNPEPYYCSKAADVPKLIVHKEAIGEEQRRLWYDKAAAERTELENRLQEAWAIMEDSP